MVTHEVYAPKAPIACENENHSPKSCTSQPSPYLGIYVHETYLEVVTLILKVSTRPVVLVKAIAGALLTRT